MISKTKPDMAYLVENLRVRRKSHRLNISFLFTLVSKDHFYLNRFL